VTGKTIIYLPNWLGDMVMAAPMLQALRASSREEIWAVGKPSAMHLYNGLDLFNRFIPYGGNGVIPFLDTVTHVGKLSFETGVVLPHSFRSALLLFLASVKRRVGYGMNKRGFMLTTAVAQSTQMPEPTVEHYLRLLDALGVPRGAQAPALKVTEDEERKFDDRFTDIGSGHIAFIVGAQYGPSKRWPESHFAALADLLIERFSLPVYLLPGKGEEKIARQVLEKVRHKESVQMKEMDVRDLKVALSRASLVVGNDTGPRHISAALSAPTIVIMGAMDERYTAYPSPHTHPMVKDVPCRPCNRKRCDRGHECLKGITPEEVLRKAEEVVRWRADQN
jgi:heptosyltransferase-2